MRNILLVLTVLIPLAGNAASFDCRKAASSVEKLVCADSELSSLDEMLEKEYRAAIRQGNENADLILDQRTWLAERNLCRYRECVVRAYWSRLADFQGGYVKPEKFNCDPVLGDIDWERCATVQFRFSPEQLTMGYCTQGAIGQYIHEACPTAITMNVASRTKITGGDQVFCRAFLTSEYTLIDLSLPHSVSVVEAGTCLNLRGATTEIYEHAGYFDINNDGKPENIGWIKAYSGAGSGCDVEQYVQLDQKRAHIADTTLTSILGEHNCSNYSRAVRYQGRTYLLNSRTVHIQTYGFVGLLTEVSILNGDKLTSVCRFSYDDN